MAISTSSPGIFDDNNIDIIRTRNWGTGKTLAAYTTANDNKAEMKIITNANPPTAGSVIQINGSSTVVGFAFDMELISANKAVFFLSDGSDSDKAKAGIISSTTPVASATRDITMLQIAP